MGHLDCVHEGDCLCIHKRSMSCLKWWPPSFRESHGTAFFLTLEECPSCPAVVLAGSVRKFLSPSRGNSHAGSEGQRVRLSGPDGSSCTGSALWPQTRFPRSGPPGLFPEERRMGGRHMKPFLYNGKSQVTLAERTLLASGEATCSPGSSEPSPCQLPVSRGHQGHSDQG